MLPHFFLAFENDLAETVLAAHNSCKAAFFYVFECIFVAKSIFAVADGAFKAAWLKMFQ